MSQINIGRARAEALRLAKQQAKENYVKNQTDTRPLRERFELEDNINVNYDPFEVHPNRWGIVKEVIPGVGYKILFTSTKGASCHGGVHKAYQRTDKTWVAETSRVDLVRYNQIIL